MEFHQVRFSDRVPIDAYGDGGFRIAGHFHAGPVLVSPSGVQTWPVTDFPAAGAEAFAALAAEKDAIDILFIGTGEELRPLPGEAGAYLASLQIGAEVMATGAACRTFNVLLSEARRVAAALLPV